MSRRGWPAWAKPTELIDLLRLALPIAVSRASMMLMVLTDTIVLGRNAPEELPYILNSWLPVGVTLGLSMGLLLGVSVITAELSGRGEESQSGRVFRRGFWLSIGFGSLMTAIIYFLAHAIFAPFSFSQDIKTGSATATQILALGLIAHMVAHAAGSYLEALRRPIIVSVILYVGVLANLIFDLAFVAGWWCMPALGADGVAIATSGSRWFIMVLLLGCVLWFTPGFKTSIAGPVGEGVRQIKLGIGLAISNVAEWGGFNSTFLVASTISGFAASVYGMSIHAVGFTFMLFLGLGTATSVRIAEGVGRSDITRAVNASRLGLAACLLLGALMAIGMFGYNDALATLFVGHEQNFEGRALQPILAQMIALAALVVIFDGLQGVCSMASRAQGLIWLPSIIHLGSYFLVMIPATIILGVMMERGVQGMIEGVIIASALAGLAQLAALEWAITRTKKGLAEAPSESLI